MKRIRKLIDLSPEAVKVLTIEAAKKGTRFKLLVQDILEEKAKRLIERK